jgi:hypothetical protein
MITLACNSNAYYLVQRADGVRGRYRTAVGTPCPATARVRLAEFKHDCPNERWRIRVSQHTA